MSLSRFRHIHGLAMILSLSAFSGARAAGAIPNPTRQSHAQAAAHAAATTAPDTRSLKFELYQDRTNQHRWRLKATNGQIIATSGQGYKDKRDAKNAIERIKSDAATRLKFETYADAAKEYRWRLKATNGQVIATSGQGYKNKGDCEHSIDVIKQGAKQANVEE